MNKFLHSIQVILLCINWINKIRDIIKMHGATMKKKRLTFLIYNQEVLLGSVWIRVLTVVRFLIVLSCLSSQMLGVSALRLAMLHPYV